jgi:hypothetical protein
MASSTAFHHWFSSSALWGPRCGEALACCCCCCCAGGLAARLAEESRERPGRERGESSGRLTELMLARRVVCGRLKLPVRVVGRCGERMGVVAVAACARARALLSVASSVGRAYSCPPAARLKLARL